LHDISGNRILDGHVAALCTVVDPFCAAALLVVLLLLPPLPLLPLLPLLFSWLAVSAGNRI